MLVKEIEKLMNNYFIATQALCEQEIVQCT